MADKEEITNIVALGFEDMFEAENMLSRVQMWEEKGYFTVKDAVVVTRGTGSADIEIKQTVKKAGKWSLGGGGIGVLAGFLLGGPVGGLIVGATVGAIAGAMKDSGIDDKFIRGISEGLPQGSSALFVMTSPTEGRNDEEFYAELKPFKARILSTTLDDEASATLKKLLEEEG